jgi:Tol biopolymer transport system component
MGWLASWNGPTCRIAFAISTGNGDIATVDPQGDHFLQVIHAGLQQTYLEPTYSLGGKLLVFEDDEPNKSEQNNRASIIRMPADGGSIEVLVKGRRTSTDDRLPVWSPDGIKILFQRIDLIGGVYDLYTIRPDGSGLHQITHGDNCDSHASWSEDGLWIADSACFNGFGPTPHSNIFLVSSDPHYLRSNARGPVRPPSRKIAIGFISSRIALPMTVRQLRSGASAFHRALFGALNSRE